MTQLVPMIGREFGRLTVVERVANTKQGQARYRCACRCGGTVETSGANLRANRSTHCGCEKRNPHVEDLTGREFGSLVVLRRMKNDRDGNTRWRCLCECGVERTILAKTLRRGDANTCGCGRAKATLKRWQAYRAQNGSRRGLADTALGTRITQMPGDKPGITRIVRHHGGW